MIGVAVGPSSEAKPMAISSNSFNFYAIFYPSAIALNFNTK
jgi:hypothetical protein